MARTKTTVNIAGRKYTLCGDESTDYIKRVAEKVNGKIVEMKDAHPELSDVDLSLLSAINLADDCVKLEEEIKAAKTEIDRLKAERAGSAQASAAAPAAAAKVPQSASAAAPAPVAGSQSRAVSAPAEKAAKPTSQAAAPAAQAAPAQSTPSPQVVKESSAKDSKTSSGKNTGASRGRDNDSLRPLKAHAKIGNVKR